MKNPIRAWVAKIIREEMQAMRHESNLKAIQDEINRAAGAGGVLQVVRGKSGKWVPETQNRA